MPKTIGENDYGAAENQLFTWSGWDQQDTMTFTFYDPELTCDLGPFKKGEKFSLANVDYERSILELFRDNEGKEVHKFKLVMRAEYVGEVDYSRDDNDYP